MQQTGKSQQELNADSNMHIMQSDVPIGMEHRCVVDTGTHLQDGQVGEEEGNDVLGNVITFIAKKPTEEIEHSEHRDWKHN